MAVNIHITIIELNALHTKRQNLFQELDAVIHLLMEAKHWGLRKSRNATSLNSRFKSLDTLKVKIISVTFRRAIRTNHKKSSKIILTLSVSRLLNLLLSLVAFLLFQIGVAVQHEFRDLPSFPTRRFPISKHWGLRKSRNATSLNSRFKSLDTLKVKIISVTFRRVIRTNHKKASKIILTLSVSRLLNLLLRLVAFLLF